MKVFYVDHSDLGGIKSLLESINEYIADGGCIDHTIDAWNGKLICAYSRDELECLECGENECCNPSTPCQQFCGESAEIMDCSIIDHSEEFVASVEITPIQTSLKTDNWTPTEWAHPIQVASTGAKIKGVTVSSTPEVRTVPSSSGIWTTPLPTNSSRLLNIKIPKDGYVENIDCSSTICDVVVNGMRLAVTCEDGDIHINLCSSEHNDVLEKTTDPIHTIAANDGSQPISCPQSVRVITASKESSPEHPKKIIQLEIDPTIPTKDLLDLFPPDAMKELFNAAVSGEIYSLSVSGPVHKNVVIVE